MSVGKGWFYTPVWSYKFHAIVFRGVQSPLFKLIPPFSKKVPTPQSVSSSPIYFSQMILHTLKDTLILLDLLQSPLCLTFCRFFSLGCIVFSENPVKEAHFFLSLSFLSSRLCFDIFYFSSCLSTPYNYTKLFLFLFL